MNWTTSRDDQPVALMRTHYGSEAMELQALKRNSVNKLWRVSTASGDFVLKRIGRAMSAKWLQFQSEAIERVRSSGVPVQALEVATDGSTTVEFAGGQWQLRKFAEGRHFSDGSADDIDAAASCMDLLHCVDVVGLPTGVENPIQDMEFWLSSDESALEDLGDAIVGAGQGELWGQVRNDYRAALSRARFELDAATYAALPHVLTHGELAGSNLVFSGNDRISCVLDWDGVDVRPRAYDLARAVLFLARAGRGSFHVHPELALRLLARGCASNPATLGEIRSIVPILELYCVPTPQFVRQLGLHSPETIEWYVNWTAEGARTVRENLNAVVSSAAADAPR